MYRSDDPYFELTEIFLFILNKHTPIKSKQVRGNQAPFINNPLNKMIKQKSKVSNKYLKWSPRKNFLNYKKVKNKSNSLVGKSKKEYFQNVSNTNSSHSNSFWNAVKSFVSNKGVISNTNIIIKAQKEEKIKVKGLENEIRIDANELIKDAKVLVKLFNNYYINIVEKTSGLVLNQIV